MLTTASARLIQFKRITVLTDLSDSSNPLIDYGAELARWYGSELLLVHSSSDLDVAIPDRALIHRAEGKVRSRISGLALHDLSPRIMVRKDIETILKDLEDYHPSLLLMASHGREGLRKWLAGSVAEKVFKGVQWPVLVLGPNFACEKPERQKQFERVLYATDLSGAAVTALHYAAGIAHDHEAALMILYVKPDSGQGFTFDKVTAQQHLSDWLQDRIEVLGETLTDAQCMVDPGNPEERILEAVEQHKIDLVVLGERGSGMASGLASHLLEGTAYKVIRSARCPVLIVPQPQ